MNANIEKALQLACDFIDGFIAECPVLHFEGEPLPAQGRFSPGHCDKNCGYYETSDQDGEISTSQCWRDWFIMKATQCEE